MTIFHKKVFLEETRTKFNWKVVKKGKKDPFFNYNLQ